MWSCQFAQPNSLKWKPALSDKQNGITRSTYWLEFLIAMLSWIYQLQMINNRVFNNSIRVVKDMLFLWMIVASENESSCPTHNWHWLPVTCRIKTNILVTIPTWPKPACVAAISHAQYFFLFKKRSRIKWFCHFCWSIQLFSQKNLK